MASVRKLVVSIEARTEKMSRGLNAADRRMQSFRRNALRLGGALVGALAGRALLRGIGDVTRAWAVQEDAVIALGAALRVTGKEGSAALERLTENASKLQQVTTAGDEAIIKATSSLAALATKLAVGELERAQQSIIGIADTFFQGNLENAALQIGKTVGGTTNSLVRYGITVDMAGTQSQRLAEILEQANRFFAISQERTQGLRGQTQQLANAWGDLKEKFGEAIAEGLGVGDLATVIRTELIPALEDAAPLFRLMGQAFAFVAAGSAQFAEFGKLFGGGRRIQDMSAADLDRLENQFVARAARQRAGLTVPVTVLPPGTRSEEEVLAMIEFQRNALRAGEAWQKAAEKTAEAERLAAQRLRASAFSRPGTSVQGITPGPGDLALRFSVPTGVAQAAPTGFQELSTFVDEFFEMTATGAERLAQTQQVLQLALDRGVLTQDEYTDAVQRAAEMYGMASRDMERVGIAALHAAGAFAQMAIQGRASIGSILGLAGGVASVIPGGQVVGAGLIAAGGIASAIESRRHDVTPVSVQSFGDRALRQQRDVMEELVLIVAPGAFNDPRFVEEFARIQQAARGRRIVLERGGL